MKKIVTLCVLSALILGLNNCTSSKSSTASTAKASPVLKSADGTYIPTEANVSAGISLAELEKGHVIYSEKCGKCHRLFSPTRLDAAGWKNVMIQMQPKAQISNESADLVLKYLNAYKKM